jgi:hypothetical protein
MSIFTDRHRGAFHPADACIREQPTPEFANNDTEIREQSAPNFANNRHQNSRTKPKRPSWTAAPIEAMLMATTGFQHSFSYRTGPKTDRDRTKTDRVFIAKVPSPEDYWIEAAQQKI